ncbi:MAG: acetoacetate decarboxylase family protein [Ignavibacteriales bacterium]
MTKNNIPPAPQLVTDAWMLYMGFKSDPGAIRALLPQRLEPHPDDIVVINLYTVPDPSQTSGFGAYTLTYITLQIKDHDTYILGSDVGMPGRFWVGYFNSSEVVRDFTRSVGIPAEPGVTTLKKRKGKLKAVLEVGGQVFVEATADVGDKLQAAVGGHLNYFTQGKLQGDSSETTQIIKFSIPFVSRPVRTENATITFKMPENHPLYSLKPISVEWASYVKGSFVYPQHQII